MLRLRSCRCRASRPLVEGNADSDPRRFQQQWLRETGSSPWHGDPSGKRWVAPLGLLVISGGQYANTTMPLKAGVTTLGRDGRLNDHKIDDDVGCRSATSASAIKTASSRPPTSIPAMEPS